MPPRMRSSRFSSLPRPSPNRTSSARQSIAQNTQTSRQFSQTPCHQVTLRRRKFYAWLNGPGMQLKEPLPESTNYLGAYDQNGTLVRAGPEYQRASARSRDESKIKLKESRDEAAAPTEETTTPEGQESLEKLESAAREEDAKKKDAEQDGSKLPPETAEDLRPYPMNPYFRSQPVLSEELREAIYQRVKRDGATVSLASVEFGVSNERVGAVVRLKQMEKEWIAQGKTLAIPYAKALLEMLPTTPHIDTSDPMNKGKKPIVHEPINDLIVHPATRQQLWVPVAESRQFTREDAGKAFDNSLLPADKRIPHPELVLAERELASGLSFEERRGLAEKRFAEEVAEKKLEEQAKQAELQAQKVVPQRRWDFVFKDISVESAGRNGRDAKGVGWRYGLPHQDRKKGQVKIPTKVEA
ncbi:eukaryotic mitochondrial regulator protein-domain-containing protein [Boeremia exigua]|uniref:eukaryotic mitochondrial regulator protein-domain-containing protein n=1 Tax=Boeremia exigua TaxID=749465 RepID=UPI001E8CC84C|nr:eukaryotic mitochondrial regulator protein-domain-containing protein [Boeremia exigua]KAH6643817.1 eukaryotic mitochondrial regulator protein-domain-containing protein [Boeremia exigua]